MNEFLRYLGLSALLACVNVASAQMDSKSPAVLVSWNLDGLSRAGSAAELAQPTVVHSAVQSSDLTLGNYLIPTAWADSLTVYAKDLVDTLGFAIALEQYYTFSVTPKKGKKISYSGIFSRATINTGNLETGASIQFVLMSSITGFGPADQQASFKPLASFIVKHPAQNDKATTVTEMFDISGVEALQNVDESVEFRIYAVLVDGVGNRMGFGHIFYQDKKDDLRVMGTVR